MLPRWCNSIPDSEYLALYDAVARLKLPRRPVFVETGSGASTIVLSYFAVKTGGELFTWDTNGSKLFYLRSVLNDTLMRHFTARNLNSHWRYIAFDSTSPHAGVGILAELKKKVSVCFLDSEHVLDVLMSELESICRVLADIGIVAIDDANYNYKSHNTAYINMIRKKLGLSPIASTPDNMGRFFWQEVQDYLKANFRKVRYLKDSYKRTYRKDIFWAYYAMDREAMAGLAMEKTADLNHRFDAWKIWK